MFTLSCPRCGSADNIQVTAAMPLRAWLHCGACNHLWKMSGVTLLCRWIAGGNMNKSAERAREVPEDMPVAAPLVATVDPAIEHWLCQGSDETRHATDVSVSEWLDSDPLAQSAREPEMPGEEYFLPSLPKPAAAAQATLGERLDTFYDGLTRLEEFVKRCARQEEALAEAAAQALAASAKAAAATAKRPATVRRGDVLPFKRLAG